MSRDIAYYISLDIQQGERDRAKLIRQRERALDDLANADYRIECLDRRLAGWRAEIERLRPAPEAGAAVEGPGGE